MDTAPCMWCDDTLTFGPGKPGDDRSAWRHQDGSVYVSRLEIRANGVLTLVDDHCATPVRS